MIRNPNDIQEGAKKIRMLIAGYPGIGKSTLALSAPNPLHIDVDFGIDRIEPRYRKPYIQPQSYDEILGDLTPINLQDFDTLVFDTGGKLISSCPCGLSRKTRSMASATAASLSRAMASSVRSSSG